MTFKIEDICAIIKECGQNGVAEFSYGELTLIYKEAPHYLAPTIEPLHVPQEIQNKADSQARDALTNDEVAIAQHELDQMVIEDPDRFFELTRRGDLINENRSET